MLRHSRLRLLQRLQIKKMRHFHCSYDPGEEHDYPQASDDFLAVCKLSMLAVILSSIQCLVKNQLAHKVLPSFGPMTNMPLHLLKERATEYFIALHIIVNEYGWIIQTS